MSPIFDGEPDIPLSHLLIQYRDFTSLDHAAT